MRSRASRALGGLAARTAAPRPVWQRVPGKSSQWRLAGAQPAPSPSLLAPLTGALAGTRALEAMLLPRNFPESVRPGYLAYVQWTALGLVTGRVQSVLATQAALFSVGVGAGAVPMAAAIQWVLKDGVGHATAIGYATAVNTRFDADARRYRFHSTFLNTVADMIAVTMPLAPTMFPVLGVQIPSFLLLASLSSATSGVAGVAHAAARARVMASFALRGNLADCTRAGQTQAKLMSLFGTAVGIGVSWAVGPQPLFVMGAMVPLSALSLLSTYKSCRLVVLRTLNVQRTERVYHFVLDQMVARLLARGAAKVVIARSDGGSAHEQAPSLNLPAEPSMGLAMEMASHIDDSVVPSPECIANDDTIAFGYRSCFRVPLELQPLIIDVGLAHALAAEAEHLREKLSSFEVTPTGFRSPGISSSGCVRQASEGSSSGWRVQWHADGAYALARRLDSDFEDASPIYLWFADGVCARYRLQGVWHACVHRYLAESLRRQHEVAAVGGTALSRSTSGEIPASFNRDPPLLSPAALDELALASWPAIYETMRSHGWEVEVAFLDGAGGCLDVDGPGVRSQARKDAEAAAKEAKAGRAAAMQAGVLHVRR